MSTTKEIKTLLQELREALDPESRALVEPILRSILDAAKPKTVTEVEYRSDPKDRAEIEALRATLASKDESIRKLQAKLPSPPPLLDHMSFDDRLNEIALKAKAWGDCTTECMVLARDSGAHRHRRKDLLRCSLAMATHAVANYLIVLEGLNDKMDAYEIVRIVNESAVQWLKDLARDIEAASRVKVNLDFFWPVRFEDGPAERFGKSNPRTKSSRHAPR